MVALAPPMPVALTRATSPSPPTVTLADPPPRVTSLRTVVVVTVPLVTALLPPTVSVTPPADAMTLRRSEEHTSELQSLMRLSYAVFCLKNNKSPVLRDTLKPKKHTRDKTKKNIY